MSRKDLTIAFLSMEMALPELEEPACGANFKGGLGIFSGDTMSGLAKCGIKTYAFVPFYHRHPTTREAISYKGISCIFEGEEKQLGLQKIYHFKRGNGKVEIFGLERNDIFDLIYTEDRRQRLRQEILMGKAPVQILKKMGVKPDIIWLNESHTALAIPEIREDPYFERTKTLFTIHTPEQAGMEKFWDFRFDDLKIDASKYYYIFIKGGILDLTWASAVLADKMNAVSREHAETTKKIFSQFKSKIISIKNGTDRDFWLNERLKLLGENFSETKLWEIHQINKAESLQAVAKRSGIILDIFKPTIWWVRRIAEYKNQYPMLKDIIFAICAERGNFIETPLGRLESLGMQMVCAGRAAETDNNCLFWMEEFNQWTHRRDLAGKFVFLPAYDIELLKIGAFGCDLWLCTPKPYREACGTSDQRATLNGNPVLTTKTGGTGEYVKEFDILTGKGNGFFIDPYNPLTLYQKLKIVSDIYYSWREKNDPLWLKIKMNAFRTGKSLDISFMVQNYKKKIFDALI